VDVEQRARQWAERSDISARSALVVMAALAALSCVLLAVSTASSAWLAWPVAILIGFGSNAWNTVANLAIIRSVPLADAGRSSGIMLLGFLLGVSVGTPLSGLAIDASDSYTQVWLASGVLSLVGVAVAYERRNRAGTEPVGDAFLSFSRKEGRSSPGR